MADKVMRGKVLGHSISEILPSGYASYTGIEFEREDGEVVWLRNASMGSRCHYLFEAAILAELAGDSDSSDRLMIDATHLKAHRTAASLLKKGLYPDVSGAAAAA